jgi:branched-chain amino acid transport system permease protein
MRRIAPIAEHFERLRLNQWGVVTLTLLLFVLPIPAMIGWEQSPITNSLLFSLTQMFMLITLSSDWNLISGFTGYIDFGHITFFGLGAYSTGILMAKLAWPFFPTLLVGGIISMGAAILIGRATMHLKGPYFSIAMMATFAATREIVRVARPFTGGGPGLTLPPYLNRPLFYYVTLCQAVIVIVAVWWIRRSAFGATLVAIREDETGAEMRGINTNLHKVVVFAIAALSSGVVGGLWAYQNTFIAPDLVFMDSRTIEIAIMTILGGLGTVPGPVIGAIIIYWLRDAVWANLLQFHLIAEGILLIVIILLLPRGILGSLRQFAAGIREFPNSSLLDHMENQREERT